MGRWHRRGFSTYSRTVVEQKEKKISDWLQSFHPAIHRAVSGGYNVVKEIFETDSSNNKEDTAVDEFLREIDKQPFYGFVHLMDTHAWYEADPELVDLLLAQNDYAEGDLRSFFEKYSESPVVSNVLEPNATPADYEAGLARLFARYDATVRQADQKLKTLIDGLKKRDRWNETALFVLSDHGESLDEHGIYFDHHGLYEQIVNIPLVARVPEGVNDQVNDFVQLHDLGPTILDLLDIDPIDDADGQSLTGYIYESTSIPEPRERIFVEEAHTQRRRSVRTERFKYIDHVHDEVLADTWENDSFECGYCNREHGERTELYDLDADPEEVENITTERVEVIQEMQGCLAKFEESQSGATAVDEAVTYDDEDEILDRLEDLGYK
jgi:arylsulfatase A-like enzyme